MDDLPLALAERVVALALDRGVSTALIGANALAVHGYIRATGDIDLAAATTLDKLEELNRDLRAAGFSTDLRYPDDDDPLGGSISIWTATDEDGPIDEVEIINFLLPSRATRLPVQAMLRESISLGSQTVLRAVTLPHLVVLKLYAGSLRDRADIVELLARNPHTNVDEIRALCTAYHLDGFEPLLVEARQRR